MSWLRSLRDQCARADVPYFLKQGVCALDDCPDHPPADADRDCLACTGHAGIYADHGSKRRGGGIIELPYLDGVQHAAFPAVRL